jgi:DNA-binding transcriptional MerR regulator
VIPQNTLKDTAPVFFLEIHTPIFIDQNRTNIFLRHFTTTLKMSHKDPMSSHENKLTIDEVSGLTAVSPRTIRFYIQKGLVDRPVGQRKAAHYTREHVRQLLEIEKWKAAGVSLEAIRGIMTGELTGPDAAALPRTRRAGEIRICSRVWLAPGLELHLDPSELKLDNNQLRQLAGQITALVLAMNPKE